MRQQPFDKEPQQRPCSRCWTHRQTTSSGWLRKHGKPAAFVAARPALAPFAAPRPPPFVPEARSTFAAELIAANPGPQAREDPPPVFYDEAGQCSICHEDFEDSERVCRLRCRHMFHSACWERVMSLAGTPNEAAGGNTRFRDDCPNCRGQGALIAVWD